MICGGCGEWSETWVNVGTTQDYCPICGDDLNEVGYEEDDDEDE